MKVRRDDFSIDVRFLSPRNRRGMSELLWRRERSRWRRLLRRIKGWECGARPEPAAVRVVAGGKWRGMP